MKQRYPIGRQHFGTIREEGAVYIDKTGLIYSLVNNCTYLMADRCSKLELISRPKPVISPDGKSFREIHH